MENSIKNKITTALNFLLYKKGIGYRIILGCVFFSFFNCSDSAEKRKADIAIKRITDDYLQLHKGDANYYKLVRSVIYDNYNFEIQLRSEPDSIKDRQSILMLINSKREYYAIPFFSNTYIDYWQFPNEESSGETKNMKGTFDKELRNALLFLKLDKKVELFDVAKEMRHSLLYCTDILKKDSLVMNTPIIHFGNYQVGNEKEEDVEKRLRKNYVDIMRNSRTYVLYHENPVIAYLDRKNLRIYQFIYHHDGTFSIKCYRQDQKINMIYM